MRTLLFSVVVLCGCSLEGPNAENGDPGDVDGSTEGETGVPPELDDTGAEDPGPEPPVFDPIDVLPACELGTTPVAPPAPECGEPVAGCEDYGYAGGVSAGDWVGLDDAAWIWPLFRDQVAHLRFNISDWGDNSYHDEWFLLGEGTVLRQSSSSIQSCIGQDCECLYSTSYGPVRRCCLRSPEFFQACINAQEEADEDCFREEAWVSACTYDAAQACPAR